MFRNREMTNIFLMMGSVSLLAILITAFISLTAMWIVIALAVILCGIAFLHNKWRYREIEKLSAYLRQISSGDYTLDVRDNAEGELSILKSEIYKVTHILAKHRDHLEEDKTHLTQSIADISHQLKTPLTSMVVMADLLDDHDLPTEKRLEFTHHIHVQLERLQWLVSSLLKLSKIDAGTVYFKKDRVNVKRIIEQALESVLVPIDIKQQSVQLKGDETTCFIGDSHWTKEALINILKNCVEHTPEGGSIEIQFSENVLFTEIVITDSGKGIRKEDLPYIFQRFYKGQQASEESVGIGLAMAHRIITSQGGDIEVTSEIGKGTQFFVKFYRRNSVKK